MLFKTRELEGIAAGTLRVAFRRWRRPTVKAGGTLRTPVGVLAIEAVDQVAESDLSDAEARLAGFASRDALAIELSRQPGVLYRIRFGFVGPDPRVRLRDVARLSDRDLSEIRERLARWDARSRHGPWAWATLRVIGARPGVLAGTLASGLGYDRLWFKAQVRKLKELGLTESLEVGYRLSPRGQALLRADDR